MISIFDGMKVSLDLATALSVIIAMLMYMWEQKKARGKKDQEEVRAALERTRVTFKDRKDYFINMALQLDNLIMDNKKNETVIDDNKKQVIIEKINRFDGKVHFFLKLMINDFKNEYIIAISNIKDKDKRNYLENEINKAIDNLNNGIDISKYILNDTKNELFNSLNKDNFIDVKYVIDKIGWYIQFLTMPSILSNDKLKQVIEGLIKQKCDFSDKILSDINTLRIPNSLSVVDEKNLKEKIMKDCNFTEDTLNMIISRISYGVTASMDKCFADIAKLSLE